MKGFTLVRLLAIMAIIAILLTVTVQIYKDYITRAKLASLLSGIGSQKVQVVEDIRSKQQVDDDDNIIIDSDKIVPDSMLIIYPILIDDIVYWGCNRIGLSDTQVPNFCNLSDFTPSDISVSNEVNCEPNQGISYNNSTQTFNVNVSIDGDITNIGNFDDIKQAVESYTEFLNE